MRIRSDSSAKAPRTWASCAARVDATLRQLAFPTSRAEWRAASDRLDALADAVRTLPPRQRHRGGDSGVDHSTSRHAFDLGTATWLAATYPDDVEVDWGQPGAADAAATLLRPAITHLEEDGFDSDALSMHAWIRRARGDAWPSDLAWMLDALRDTGDSLARRAAAWESAALPLRWHLRGIGVLTARLPARSTRLRGTMRKPPPQVARFVAAPPPAHQRPRLLGRQQAEAVIRVARQTLAARCREVHALSYANVREVWFSSLGDGTALAVIGVLPAMRLALEGNYAFVLFANGVPVGYGGVSPLAAQANTGINIFPAFRGTEAAALWARTLRAFHALFGVQRFVVNPFQVGGGNREALASGAFWFYHRLGFRPCSPEVATLADRLAAARASGITRNTARELRQLAASDLELLLPGWQERDRFDERWLASLSLQASARLAREGHVDRHTAIAHVTRRLRRRLGIVQASESAEAAAVIHDLAPLADFLLDLAGDAPRPRAAVRAWLRAKGAPRERDVARVTRPLLPLLVAAATTSSDPRAASRAASASGRQSSRRSTPRTP